MKKMKRALSLLLTLAMVLSFGVLPASAADIELVDVNEPAQEIDAVNYPAQQFSYYEPNGLSIDVKAPAGALPRGTTMEVSRLEDLARVQNAVDRADDLDGSVVLAADISFWNEGEEIEPVEGSKILVTMTAPEIAEVFEPVVVHVPDEEPAVAERVNPMPNDDLDKLQMGDQVSFEAESFSIYAVIEPVPETPRLVYHFFSGEDEFDTQIVKKTVIDGETVYDELYIPAVPIEYGQTFVGWTMEEGSTNTVTFDEIRADMKDRLDALENGSDDLVDVNVYALFHEAWILRYLVQDADGSLTVLKTVRVDKSEYPNGMQITIDDYTATGEGEEFLGWIDVSTNTQYSVGQRITLQANLDLYARLNEYFWLVFDANAGGPGSGATYTPPQLIHTKTASSVTVKPDDPERKGYGFIGWNTQANGNGTWWYKTDGSVNLFGGKLDSDVNLYAQWEAQPTSYTVIFWKQKATDAPGLADADKTYEFAESDITRTALTGSTVSLTQADMRKGNYSGTNSGAYGYYFTYNANKSTASAEVKGDGTTVLNVYYDRKEITISFYTNRNRNTLYTTPDQYEAAADGEYYYYNDPYTTGFYIFGYGPEADRVPETGEAVYYYRTDFTNRSNSNANNFTTSRTGLTYTVNYNQTTSISSGSGWNSTTDSVQSWGTNSQGYYYVYMFHDGGWFGSDEYYYIPLYYSYTSQTGYYKVGEGPNPTAEGAQRYNITEGFPGTITGLYGAPLNNWPAPTSGNTWATYNPNGNDSLYAGRPDVFLIPSAVNSSGTMTSWTLYLYSTSSVATLQEYHQNVENDEYTKFGSDGGLTSTTLNCSYDGVKGFTLYKYQINNNTEVVVPTNQTSVSISYSSGDTLKLYYNRKTYPLTFMSEGEHTTGTVTEVVPGIKYQGSLSDYGKDADGNWYYEPTNGINGYYFDGWYIDQACTTPFDFNTTMPDVDGGVVVYAKWSTYRVRLVLVPTPDNLHNDEVQFANNQALTFRLDYDEKVSGTNITGTAAIRNGYRLEGWYTTPDFQSDSRWNFSTQVNKDVAAVDMNYQSSSDWTNNTYNDNDGKHDNVKGILKLYAKWVLDTDDNRVYVRYLVDDQYIVMSGGNQVTYVPYDSLAYEKNSAGGVDHITVASAPDDYVAGFNFTGWGMLNPADNIVADSDVYQPGTTTDPIAATYILREPVVDSAGNVGYINYITFVAQFEPNPEYGATTMVVFDGNGGLSNDSAARPRYTEAVRVNENFDIPDEDAFVREGFVLVGWSLYDKLTPDEYDRLMNTVNRDGEVTTIETGDGTTVRSDEVFAPGVTVAADNLDKTDVNDSSNTVYAVWAPVFYVYHSGSTTNNVERIVLTKGDAFDLTALVDTSNFLYGGYYQSYENVSPAFASQGTASITSWSTVETASTNASEQITALIADERISVGTDAGTAYDGTNATWADYYTIAGNAIKPEAGAVYYIKEVPIDSYLQPKMKFTYVAATGQIGTSWLFTNTDDTNYGDVGFMINGGKLVGDKTTSVTITALTTGTTQTFTASGMFSGSAQMAYRMVYNNPELYPEGYTGADVCELLTEGSVVSMFWVTPDGMMVTSKAVRTYTNITVANGYTNGLQAARSTQTSTISVYQAS